MLNSALNHPDIQERFRKTQNVQSSGKTSCVFQTLNCKRKKKIYLPDGDECVGLINCISFFG